MFQGFLYVLKSFSCDWWLLFLHFHKLGHLISAILLHLLISFFILLFVNIALFLMELGFFVPPLFMILDSQILISKVKLLTFCHLILSGQLMLWTVNSFLTGIAYGSCSFIIIHIFNIEYFKLIGKLFCDTSFIRFSSNPIFYCLNLVIPLILHVFNVHDHIIALICNFLEFENIFLHVFLHLSALFD